ncbi:MAG: DUF2232 domain-containing protein [Erysipelotrichaceae bacterium]
MNNNVKRISEGAMMIAFIGVFLFLNLQTGTILESSLYWLLSFPIIIYATKYGWKDSIVVGVAMLILTMILAPITTLFYVGSSVIVGIVYGGFAHDHKSNIMLLGSCFIFTLITYVVTMLLFATVFGYDIATTGQDITNILTQLNMDIPSNIMQLAIMGTILCIILLSALQSACVHLISIILLAKLRITKIKVKNVFDIYMPKYLAYISIVVYAISLVNRFIVLDTNVALGITTAFYVILMINIAYGSIFLTCAMVLYNKKNYMIALVIAIFVPGVQTIIAMIGIADCLMNWKDQMKEGAFNGKIRKL